MYHFISGLPRAGSTLLASILNQNPACSASIMSPLGRVVTEALQAMGPSNEAESFLTDAQRRDMLRGIVDGYYSNNEHQIIFDNNRRYCANMALLNELFPGSKVIACLRAPAAIVDSFEQLFQQNPLSLSVIYGGVSNTTVYKRVQDLMSPDGVVGFALNAFRSAFFGPHKENLLCVDYDSLARFPAALMEDLSKALELPPHNYNFDAIEQIPGAEQFDRDVATPGLHSLKPKVVYEPRQSVLPPDILRSLPPAFWVKEEVTQTT
jgi:sulfotransferase